MMVRRPLLACLLLCGVVAPPARGAAPAAADESPRALSPDDAVIRTLESARYRFCVDPKYPLLPDETRWCEYLARSPDPRAARCPALLTACQAGAKADLLRRERPFHFRLPTFGGVGRFVLWAMVGTAVILLAILIARHRLRISRRDEGDTAGDDSRPPIVPSSQPTGDERVALERDVDRLLARARAAATARDFGGAIADLHAALLRRLAGDGHLRIQPWSTNGDYVRALRGRVPELAAPVEEVVRVVEATAFGDHTAPDERAYQTVLGRVMALLAQSGGVMVSAAFALAALVALGLLSACLPPLRADWAGSPSGSAAVIEFLDASGLQTYERLSPVQDVGKPIKAQPAGGGASGMERTETKQLVLLPGTELADADWKALRAWLGDEDHTLVLAGKVGDLPPWLKTIEIVDTGAIGPVQATAALAAGQKDGAVALAIKPHQLGDGRVPGGAWIRTSVPSVVPAVVPAVNVLLERGANSYAVVAATDVAGRVIVFADPHLFTNAALAVAANAVLLAAVLAPGEAPVEVAGEDTGVAAPTPLASVTRGRLAPFLLQLGVCVVLFLIMRGRAFGRLADFRPPRRRAFSEHVRALGTQYARAHAARHVLGLYAAWAVERLRERIRLSSDRGIGDLSGAVATRTGRPLGEVARVLFTARRDGDTDTDGDDDGHGDGSRTRDRGHDERASAAVNQHLAMMRDLAEIVRETSGATRDRAAIPNAAERRVRR